MYACVCMCVCVLVYVRIQTRARTRAHTHTHTRATVITKQGSCKLINNPISLVYKKEKHTH